MSNPIGIRETVGFNRQPGVCPQASAGFTLIEMLTVMGVMAILWALAVPAFTGILSGHRLSTAAGQLSGAIGRGLLFSRAQNTYVWLHVFPEGDEVVLKGFFSRDGTSDGQAPANVSSAWDTQRLEGVALVGDGGGEGALRPEADAVLPESGGWLVITPRGEVMLVPGGEGALPVAPESPVRWTELALGEVSGSGANVAILQVAGLTGQRVIYRP